MQQYESIYESEERWVWRVGRQVRTAYIPSDITGPHNLPFCQHIQFKLSPYVNNLINKTASSHLTEMIVLQIYGRDLPDAIFVAQMTLLD